MELDVSSWSGSVQMTGRVVRGLIGFGGRWIDFWVRKGADSLELYPPPAQSLHGRLKSGRTMLTHPPMLEFSEKHSLQWKSINIFLLYFFDFLPCNVSQPIQRNSMKFIKARWCCLTQNLKFKTNTKTNKLITNELLCSIRWSSSTFDFLRSSLSLSLTWLLLLLLLLLVNNINSNDIYPCYCCLIITLCNVV